MESAEVLVDEEWHPAEVLSWSSTPSGWWANVRWWPAADRSMLDTFPESSVRQP